MDPGILAQVLRELSTVFQNLNKPDMLVGLDIADDAGVYRLNDDQAIISTIDFFTPVVDDPYDYGAIAAANAMSDVYAMGGQVLFALNVVAFPPKVDHHYLTEILRGGAESVRQAGAVIVGGHTIQDAEPKYGLAVTGLVHPNRIFRKGGAQPGDVLVLSKPLGSGTISTALKRDIAEAAHAREMIDCMKKLNRTAALAGQKARVQGATDITGFGFLGHATEMMLACGQVQFRFHFNQIPLLSGSKQYAEDWIFPGGSHNNREYFREHVTFDPAINEAHQMLLWDAQTSGGLLLAVPSSQIDTFFDEIQQRDEVAWIVGEAVEGTGIRVTP